MGHYSHILTIQPSRLPRAKYPKLSVDIFSSSSYIKKYVEVSFIIKNFILILPKDIIIQPNSFHYCVLSPLSFQFLKFQNKTGFYYIIYDIFNVLITIQGKRHMKRDKLYV